MDIQHNKNPQQIKHVVKRMAEIIANSDNPMKTTQIIRDYSLSLKK